MQWGVDHIESNRAIVKTALLVAGIAGGAYLMVPVLAAIGTACATGGAPACVAATGELVGSALEGYATGTTSIATPALTAAFATRMAAEIKAGSTAAKSLAMIKADVEIAQGTITVDTKGNALIGDWSNTKTLSSPANADAHWIKHQAEFPEFTNAGQYIKGTQDFVNNPPAGTLSRLRLDGDTVYYNPITDTFAVKSPTGAPRTMFVPNPVKHGYPSNLDYFNAQK